MSPGFTGKGLWDSSSCHGRPRSLLPDRWCKGKGSESKGWTFYSLYPRLKDSNLLFHEGFDPTKETELKRMTSQFPGLNESRFPTNPYPCVL